MKSVRFAAAARFAVPVRFAVPARFAVAGLLAAGLTLAAQTPQTAAAPSQYPALPTEFPAHFQPPQPNRPYVERIAAIPMRDGTKLNTVILIPKGATHAGIVLDRTPYNADGRASREGYDPILEAGYIHVIQDVRGKYGSEGDYIMNRYVLGPLNPTGVSDATDCSDTISWLANPANLPEGNGRVATIGISYDGYEAAMSLVHPNPHLKAAIPENPMVDGWRGDDWFHYGAFREQMIPYIYQQDSSRDSRYRWWQDESDDYTMWLKAGNPSVVARAHDMEQLGFWRKLVEHPAYDEFWRDQAVDKILAQEPLTVPTLLVGGEWDQEDIYGALAIYRALYATPANRANLYLVLGPWYHGEEARPTGDRLGAIRWGSDTSAYFTEHILLPFLAQHIGDGADAHLAHVNAFLAGADHWEQLASWPACPGDCAVHEEALYLQGNHGLAFHPPAADGEGYDQYVSDPANPVPYRPRPTPRAETPTWPEWLVGDQREVSGRPDVEVYETPVLTQAVRISGRPAVHLAAATSGTDADWVVKLIDVYPSRDLKEPDMDGYELAVAMDIFRGRYRTSWSHPEALTPNVPLVYQFHLPAANYVFLPGHRIMVQIQSSWFPLYDRNPQTFVANIFQATPADYVKATQRIYHTPEHATYLELPVAQGR
ncbi:MAG TPA: CocE/NonD family hydrolase [Terriglobales bacterium]|nr:CocE/NonD family hydrolase [Terriglobales bacterium]